MDTIFMNSENSKTSEHNVLVLKLTDKLDLRRGQKTVALSNFSIHYTWKNVKSSYNNNKFKISAPTWSEEFKLPDGSYSVSDIQDYFEYILKKHSESSLCDYSDGYILVKGTITVNNTAAQGAAANNTNKKVIFKNCAPFTNFISEINNTQIDNAKDIDIVMPMYNLIEYSDNYAKTTGSLWQYCKDILARKANNNNIVIFAEGNLLIHLSLKQKSQVKLEMMEQKMLK